MAADVAPRGVLTAHAAVGDLDYLGGGSTAGSHILDGFKDMKARHNLTKDAVVAVKEVGRLEADEEARPAGVGVGLPFGVVLRKLGDRMGRREDPRVLR